MDVEGSFERLVAFILYIILGIFSYQLYQIYPYPVAWFVGFFLIGFFLLLLPTYIAEEMCLRIFKYRYCHNCYSKLPKDAHVCPICYQTLEDLELYNRNQINKLGKPSMRRNYKTLIYWIQAANPDVDWKNLSKSEGDMIIHQTIENMPRTDKNKNLILGLKEYAKQYGYNAYFRE